MTKLSHDVLAQLFTEARTHNGWLDKPVSDATLHELFELTKFAPTAANSSPMRVVFVKSAEAKAKLKPLLAEGNVEKTMSAPVTAIVAYDMDFNSHMLRLFPHVDARGWFEGPAEVKRLGAMRNGSLQAAFLMMAARSLGLDCGPMSGFDNAGVDAAFFAGTKIESNFLINLGYGDASKLMPRLPRFDFKDVCSIA